MIIPPITPYETIALIPARAGSKGLPGKNSKILNGKPLFMYSVEAALSAGISRVFISTDSDDILNFNLPRGVHVLHRAPHLCTDVTYMSEVVSDFLENSYTGNCAVVLLQPTSPLRTHLHVTKALKAYEAGNRCMTMSVCVANSGVLKWGFVSDGKFESISNVEYCFANRQSLPDLYRPNGAIYVFDAEEFRFSGAFPVSDIRVITMSEKESFDIDTLADFNECEKIISQGVA